MGLRHNPFWLKKTHNISIKKQGSDSVNDSDYVRDISLYTATIIETPIQTDVIEWAERSAQRTMLTLDNHITQTKKDIEQIEKLSEQIYQKVLLQIKNLGLMIHILRGFGTIIQFSKTIRHYSRFKNIKELAAPLEYVSLIEGVNLRCQQMVKKKYFELNQIKRTAQVLQILFVDLAHQTSAISVVVKQIAKVINMKQQMLTFVLQFDDQLDLPIQLFRGGALRIFQTFRFMKKHIQEEYQSIFEPNQDIDIEQDQIITRMALNLHQKHIK